MSPWSDDELHRIAGTDDLHVAPFRNDGKSYGTLTWIWSVVVGNALYARAYHGESSNWYRAAIRQRAGRITAAGLVKEVTFDPVASTADDPIDIAYRTKYSNSPYLGSMVGPRARAATVRICPRDAG